jgi:hypothetical protein
MFFFLIRVKIIYICAFRRLTLTHRDQIDGRYDYSAYSVYLLSKFHIFTPSDGSNINLRHPAFLKVLHKGLKNIETDTFAVTNI